METIERLEGQAKHLEEDLEIVPKPSLTGERRAEIRGRAKSDSLLTDQEAVCLQVVAEARTMQAKPQGEDFFLDVGQP
jgi:hypothetical protein